MCSTDCDPSRTAAIGATRVARTAGVSPAITVSTIPSSSETTTVLSSIGCPASGRARSSALKRAESPFASATPARSPTADATAPVRNASSTTDRRTCRRDAPSVRSVASSRVRCATVIESVLKMTKPPTNNATNPNARRNQRMYLTKNAMSFSSFAACAAPVRTTVVAGTTGRRSRTSCCGETPFFASTAIAVKRPSR